jgi:hypothetical protein
VGETEPTLEDVEEEVVVSTRAEYPAVPSIQAPAPAAVLLEDQGAVGDIGVESDPSDSGDPDESASSDSMGPKDKKPAKMRRHIKKIKLDEIIAKEIAKAPEWQLVEHILKRFSNNITPDGHVALTAAKKMELEQAAKNQVGMGSTISF